MNQAAPMNTEVKVYNPSSNLLSLVDNIKKVAKFDPGILQVFEQATKIAAVNQLMTCPEMEDILDKLEGNPAGFQTDLKNGEKYDKKTRNMAVTHALSQGGRLVNKEFGIIKSNAFMQKNFYQRMLDELGKDNTFLESCKYRMLWWDTELGEIKLNGAIALCETRVTYKLFDKTANKELEEKVFTRTFQIKTFPSDTPDLWAGKFERRAWQKLLRYLSGIDFGEDADEGGAAPAPMAPPVGITSLAPEKKAEKPAQTAEDASFQEIVKAKEVSAPSAPAPEATSKTQTKPYAEMNAAEKKAATIQAHDESLKATTSPAAAPEPTPPAANGKPELF